MSTVTKAQPGSGGAARRAADAITNLAHENVEIKNMVRSATAAPAAHTGPRAASRGRRWPPARVLRRAYCGGTSRGAIGGRVRRCGSRAASPHWWRCLRPWTSRCSGRRPARCARWPSRTRRTRSRSSSAARCRCSSRCCAQRTLACTTRPSASSATWCTRRSRSSGRCAPPPPLALSSSAHAGSARSLIPSSSAGGRRRRALCVLRVRGAGAGGGRAAARHQPAAEPVPREPARGGAAAGAVCHHRHRHQGAPHTLSRAPLSRVGQARALLRHNSSAAHRCW